MIALDSTEEKGYKFRWESERRKKNVNVTSIHHIGRDIQQTNTEKKKHKHTPHATSNVKY